MEAITPKLIKNVINEKLNIDISKKTRLRYYSDVRSVYYVLCREYTNYSLEEIGKEVNRHHASVLHGIKNIFPIIDKVLYTTLKPKFKEIIEKNNSMKNYNGWTNNATWRVNVDILGDIEFKKSVTADELKEIVEECVFSNYEMKSGSHLIEDYARSFLSKVNYYEIAEAINTDMLIDELNITN